ncbi:hypothetical protein [Pseudokineococcus sp. 1T1Z-3]|uniref:hypothetical protein n=1 Tax=Pseudokineococcus sp. 1T1Z-3 TaxID=3132745 RepID=UPI0030B220E1
MSSRGPASRGPSSRDPLVGGPIFGRGDGAKVGLAPPLRLEGVLEQGVEKDAVVLRVEPGRTYLVGRQCAHLLGHRVRVLGAERLGVMTTAQQGPPLVVQELEDLGPA